MKMAIGVLAPLCFLAFGPAPAAAQAVPPTTQAAAVAAPQVGLIALGLHIADMERSLKFYVEGLSLKPLSRNERGETIEQFLGYPAMPSPPVLELIAPRTPKAAAAPPATMIFKIVLSVNDAPAIAEQLRRAGVAVPPVRVNPVTGMAVFFVRDPDGYNIELVQRPVPAAAPARR